MLACSLGPAKRLPVWASERASERGKSGGPAGEREREVERARPAAGPPGQRRLPLESSVSKSLLADNPCADSIHVFSGAFPDVKLAFRSSLAYRLCLVAQGQFDAMITLRPTWEWDVAAGTLILAEAGGNATTQKGQAIAFNNPHPQLDGLVAAGGLQASLLALLA